MIKTVYVKKVKEKSQYLPHHTVLVETYFLLGFIPVYRRERLLEL